MKIEKDIFKRSIVITNKLKRYGFNKFKDYYVIEKTFLNNEFKAIIEVDKNGIVNGKIIDLEMDEEYLIFRTEANGEFVNRVRNEYINILRDIKNNCFEERYFVFNQSNRITKLIKDKYNINPEFLWDNDPSGVFRNPNTSKWFGIIMNIDISKISNGSGEVEVINVKLDRNKILDLLNENGFYKAYHMNKKDWISIILNDTIPDKRIMDLINESYNLVN